MKHGTGYAGLYIVRISWKRQNHLAAAPFGSLESPGAKAGGRHERAGRGEPGRTAGRAVGADGRNARGLHLLLDPRRSQHRAGYID
ncbi:hypothetical protein D3C73_1272710 [compost metagenome]